MPLTPATPFFVPLSTPPAERLALLRDLVHDAVRDPAFWDVAALAAGRVTRAEPVRLARELLTFAQAFPYVPDPRGTEQFQPVMYTVMHGGDCEDHATLLAALFSFYDLPAQLVWIDQLDSELNHVSTRVQLGGTWYWAEPSVPGARLGEEPRAAAARTGFHERIGG